MTEEERRAEITRKNNKAMDEFFDSFKPGQICDTGICTGVDVDERGRRSVTIRYPVPGEAGKPF